jgi:hypothetical protein
MVRHLDYLQLYQNCNFDDFFQIQCCHRTHHRRCRQFQNYLLAVGADVVAGVTFLSSFFAGLLTGCFSSFLAVTATVGAVATGVAGALAGSAAKEDTANTVARMAITFFILISF